MIAAGNELGWQWRDPLWLLLLVVPIGLAIWRHQRTLAVPFAAALLLRPEGAGPHAAPALPTSWRQRLACVPALLELLGLWLGIVALARPVQRVPLPPERQGLDVLLCVDTSSSMATDDLAAGRSRHAVALELAAEFLDRRRTDRTGFVTFARYADLRCPPSLDHAAVAELVRAVPMVGKDSPEDATGIGGAVALAARALSTSPAKGKVVVLLTDGEENVATAATPQEIAPLHAAQLCQRLAVRVHSVVLGRGNRRPDGSFVPLDTTAVQQLASRTGGRFFTATDAAALQQVYRDIDALEKVAFQEPRVLVVEWFAAPLALGLVLVAFAALLRRRGLEVLP